MSVAITDLRRHVIGHIRVVTAIVTFDSSYPTGGEPLSAQDLGLGELDFIKFEGAGGLLFEYDHSAGKVLAKYPTGGAAVPAALAVPAVTFPAGATPVTSDAAQPNLVETAGIAAQVANATDLSTIVTRLWASGR